MREMAKRCGVGWLAGLALLLALPGNAAADGNVMGGTGLYLTHAAETLEPGTVRLGIYGQFLQYYLLDDPMDWDFAPQMAYAPFRNLEIMAAVPLRDHIQHGLGDGETAGIGDGILGLKYRFRPRVAALAYTSLPFGDEEKGLGSGGTDIGVAGIVSVPLGAGVQADLNAGYRFAGVAGDEADDFVFYAAGVSLPIGSRTKLFGELAGRFVTEGCAPDTHQFDLGVRYHFSDHLALTTGGGSGFKREDGPDDPRWRWFLGFSMLFGEKTAPAPVAPPGGAKIPPAAPVPPPAPQVHPVAPAAVSPAAVAPPAGGEGRSTVPAGGVEPKVPPPVAPLTVVTKHTPEEIAAARKRLEAVEIHFEYDRARLVPEAEQKLRQAAADLAEFTELKFSIEGHADDRGTASYNKVLGLRRAEAVMRFLVKSGIAFERMRLATQGELKPKASSKDSKSRALNRRAVLTVLP